MKRWTIGAALRTASIGFLAVLFLAAPASAKKFKLGKAASKAVDRGGKAVVKGAEAAESGGKAVVKGAEAAESGGKAVVKEAAAAADGASRLYSAADEKSLLSSAERGLKKAVPDAKSIYDKAMDELETYLSEAIQTQIIAAVKKEYDADKTDIEATSKAFRAVYATPEGRAAVQRIGKRLAAVGVDAEVLRDVAFINSQLEGKASREQRPDQPAPRVRDSQPKAQAAGGNAAPSSKCYTNYQFYAMQFDGTIAGGVGGNLAFGVAWDPCQQDHVFGYFSLGGVAGIVGGGSIGISFQWSKAGLKNLPGSSIGFNLGGAVGGGAVWSASWNHVKPGFGGPPTWGVGPDVGFLAEADFAGGYTWKMGESQR